ncbi:TIGR02588 family protein [Neorhizobium lilium]|uniref:TIGR02588 family protein n=1 Tax=Neorhizobium lilium TaxID=2503024 RepID=A0A444LN31_9HYPH|nr:TIGR02588 family protein [Neorhizobium lilium]RWX81741.1 TIGR02588 family protein [Neorhizobium lilium]
MTNIIDNRPSEADNPGWIEWATGLLAAVLVIGMLVWVTWEALTQENRPPEFTVTITGRQMVQGNYRVSFDIANTAPQTASAVAVRGEIIQDGKAVEEVEVTFDYVPAQSQAAGAVLFSRDPGQDEVRVRAVGYTTP